MNDLPLISAVITTHNRADLLCNAIESVLAQTYPHLEVVVVDDASTDSTKNILRAYGDRIVSVVTPSPQGPSYSRNLGAQTAKGRFVAFLDDDDTWMPEKISRQVEAVLAAPEPDRVACFTRVMLVYPDMEVEELSPPITVADRVDEYLFVHSHELFVPTMLVARATLLDHLFNNDLWMHEDWELYFRLQRDGVRFILVDEPLARCRRGRDRAGLTNAVTEKKRQAWLAVVRPMLSTKAYYGYLGNNFARHAVANGQRWLALTLALRAMWYGSIPWHRAGSIVLNAVAPSLHAILRKLNSRK